METFLCDTETLNHPGSILSSENLFYNMGHGNISKIVARLSPLLVPVDLIMLGTCW